MIMMMINAMEILYYKYYTIRDIENLFGKFDEDYYKPIKTMSAFDDNYMEYESKGDKD